SQESAVASQNPYDFINDVKDPKLFAGRRSELDRVKEELARLASMPGVSPVLALVGERRVGKTSLLHRISEIARSQNVLPAWIHLNGSLVSNAWEYWHEVLQAIVAAAYHAGAVHVSEPIFGFQPTEPTSSRPSSSPLPALSFGGQYAIRQQSLAAPALPPSVVLSNDLTALLSTLADAQYSAVLLMFDEAHVLAESVDLLQQLRHIV